jgi:putative PEP-CTERM system histidine kinase
MGVDVSTIGRALAAVGFAGLALLAYATRASSHRSNRQFVAALGATALSLAIPVFANHGLAVALADSLRNAIWLAFLAYLTWPPPGAEGPNELDDGLPPRVVPAHNPRNAFTRTAIALACATVLVRGLAELWPTHASVQFIAAAVALPLPLLGLAVTRMLYRSIAPERRWSVKHLCVGVFALFAWDALRATSALAAGMPFVPIELLDQASGWVLALALPLLAVGAARNRASWLLRIGASRALVFDGVALTLTALATGFALWAALHVHALGGNWAQVAAVLVVAGTLLACATFWASSRARALVRLWLSKHFYQSRFDYRLEWMRLTERLTRSDARDARTERPEARALDALARLVDTPRAALWLDDDNGTLRCVERNGFTDDLPPRRDLPADAPLAHLLRTRQWVVDLAEMRAHPERYEHFALPDFLATNGRAWLVVPLAVDTRLVGFVVLGHPRARLALDWELRDLLKAAARQAASLLATQQAAERLSRARQFESFNKMTAFVAHDLKNQAAQLSLMLRNAQRHAANPEFQQDMLGTVRNVLRRMESLLVQLRPGEADPVAPSRVPIVHAIVAAIEDKPGLAPMPTLRIAPGAERLEVVAQADRLARVIGHLLQNAAEAATPRGHVIVELAQQGEDGLVVITDDGPGMSEAFVRDRLFRPFASTKARGMGLGVYETREYVTELGGRLEVTSDPGLGTQFRISLPLANALLPRIIPLPAPDTHAPRRTGTLR